MVCIKLVGGGMTYFQEVIPIVKSNLVWPDQEFLMAGNLSFEPKDYQENYSDFSYTCLLIVATRINIVYAKFR